MSLSHSFNLLDSEGQKQQVVIARVAYAKKQIAFFDDVFSVFNNMTERKVFDCVFDPWGLLRRLETTIVLATHSLNPLLNGEASDDSTDSEPQREETARLGKAIEEKTTKSSHEQNNQNRGKISVYRYYLRWIGLCNIVIVFLSLQQLTHFYQHFWVRSRPVVFVLSKSFLKSSFTGSL
jgi:hypothetical protein